MKETPLGEADYCNSGNGNGSTHTCTPFAIRKMTFWEKFAMTTNSTQSFSFTGIPPQQVKQRNLSAKHAQAENEQFRNFEIKYNHTTRAAEIFLSDLKPKR